MASRPLQLEPDEEWWGMGTERGIDHGEIQPDKPVVLRATKGGQAADFLWATFYGYTCVSARVVNLLQASGFTGWRTYPVQVHGRKGEVLPDYFGFAVTGARIRWNRGRSEPTTARARQRKGLYFDESVWDGSDFFRVEYFTVVTGRVARLLRMAKVTNARLTPVEAVEVDESLLLDEVRSRREGRSH